MGLLPRSFFDREAWEVAPDLLGCELRHGPVALRITETEAYSWPGDTACHARSGPTARNAPLWGPPGRLYVYLCYGLHQMVNLVTGGEAQAGAVLIRACEVVRGHDAVARRRGGRRGPAVAVGPGNVGAALGVDTSFSDHRVFRPGGVRAHAGSAPPQVLRGPRVGIAYARPRDQRRRWRFACAGSPAVTQPSTLRSC